MLALAAAERPLAYGIPMHEAITAAALACLRNDGRERTALVFQNYLSDLHRGSYDADYSRGTFMNQTIASMTHFYDPATGRGFLLSRRTAASLCRERYISALRKWRAGDRSGASYDLGWAVHLLQDLTIPHHTRADTGPRTHAEYEAFLDREGSAWLATEGGIYADKEPETWIHGNAAAAAGYWYLFEGRGTPDFATAGRELVPLAVRTTAGMLAGFMARVEGEEG